MDLSAPPVIPVETNGEVIDRLTVAIVRETTALDFEMETWLSGIGQGGATRSCGLRFKAFFQHLEAVTATKRQKARIADLLTKVEAALVVRNSLVHGRFQYGLVEGSPAAFVQTLELMQADAFAKYPLTFATIESAVDDMRRAHRMLATFREQRQASRSNRASETANLT